MKYHFYSSVSSSILGGTTRERPGSKCRLRNDETSLRPRLIGSLSHSIRGGGPRSFCSRSLIPVSLLLLRFILLVQTKPALPTNAAAAFQGQASGCRGKKTAGEEQGSSEEREGKKREEIRREEKSKQFHPPRRSPAAPGSQSPTSRRPYSETHLMNTPALIQPDNGALHCH